MNTTATPDAPRQWEVVFCGTMLPPELSDVASAINLDEQRASWAIGALATSGTRPARVNVWYAGATNRPFSIDSGPESNEASLRIAIPSHTVEELQFDQTEINNLTIEGLQRVVDARSKRIPSYFAETSIWSAKFLRRKEVKQMIGGLAGVTAMEVGLTYAITENLGEPTNLIAPTTVGLTILGIATQKLREQQRYLTRRDTSLNWLPIWHPTAPKAKAKEAEHFAAALQKTANLGPLVNVAVEA